MSDVRRLARSFGLVLVVGFSGLVFGLSGPAWAQAYPPDGPDIPTITLNESEEGAAGLPSLDVPRPNRWDQQSICGPNGEARTRKIRTLSSTVPTSILRI